MKAADARRAILEKRVLDLTMKRFRQWKRTVPDVFTEVMDGDHHNLNVRGVDPKLAAQMIRACAALEKARTR